MHQHAGHQQSDGLTTLLFRLRVELRQRIYRHLVPEVDILLLPGTDSWLGDFEPIRPNCRDLLWLGTSRTIFLDASPPIYSAKPLYFHLDFFNPDDRLSLNNGLMYHAQSAYPDDAEWTFTALRSQLVKKLALEIHTSTFFEELPTLLARFAAYSAQLQQFTALEELYISVRPHYGTLTRSPAVFHYIEDTAKVQQLLGEVRDMEPEERLVKRYASLLCLCRAVWRIKKDVAAGCAVQWWMPGAEFPRVSHRRSDLPERKLNPKETMVIELMENLWSFVSSQSEEQLGKMLLEEEDSPAEPCQLQPFVEADILPFRESERVDALTPFIERS